MYSSMIDTGDPVSIKQVNFTLSSVTATIRGRSLKGCSKKATVSSIDDMLCNELSEGQSTLSMSERTSKRLLVGIQECEATDVSLDVKGGSCVVVSAEN